MVRRTVSSNAHDHEGKSKRTSRSVQSHVVRSSIEKSKPQKASTSTSSTRKVRVEASTSHIKKSAPGQFVDARRLKSEDLVSKTLRETTGHIGMLTRPKVVDFQSRLKERRSVNKRAVAQRIAIIVGSLILVIAVLWALLFSPLFRLEHNQISVTGNNSWVSKEQILSIAQQQEGKSLLLVSTKTIEQELSDIPGVFSAKANKRFPHGLSVTVQAQQPAAMLQERGSKKLTAVDGKGRVLNSVHDVSVAGIPVIEVNDVDAALKKRAVKSAVIILNDLSENMRKEITKVSAATQDSITTQLSNGYTIVWGNAADLKLKKAVVDKIMNDPNVIGDKKQIDVSAPMRPIIK